MTDTVDFVPPGGPPPDDPLPGMQLGDFVVEKAVAWGGMGIIYRAVHPLIGRKVAIKVLRPSFASDPEQVSRFLAEAKAVAAIKHRGIIDIIGFGKVPDGRQYMVMEFLEGETLEAVMLREGPMTPARALALIEQLLDALSAAHQAGVVHRDLKPANVYLALQSDGSRYVKVVDFGLARQASIAELNRQSGRASIMAGTPEYFSPEQAKGLAATPRTDLYCLGVMVFEMMTGGLPFKGDTLFDLLNGHLNIEAPRASTQVANLPPQVDDLIAQLLEKQPEKRPSSADVARQTVLRIIRKLKEDATAVGVTMRPPPAAPEKTEVLLPGGIGHAPTSIVPVTERLKAAQDTDRDLSQTPKVEVNRPTALEVAPTRERGNALWIGLGVLLSVIVGGLFFALRPAAVVKPAVVVEAPKPPPVDPAPPVVAVAAVEPAPAPAQKPEPVPAVPVKRPTPAVPTPRPRPVSPAKPVPECEDGANWQALLRQTLQKVEQRFRGGEHTRQEAQAGDGELTQLQRRVPNVKTRPACLELVKSIDAFRSRYGG